MSDQDSKSSFFRQSGWMVIATVGGGVFMTAVHTVAARMGNEEYGVFLALLGCLTLITIPSGALQTVFAQQTAASNDPELSRRLKGTTRSVLGGIFLLWVAMMIPVFIWKDGLRSTLKISSETALWLTMVIALTSLWTPVIKGLLQGRQNFMGLGWVVILDGVTRFIAVCVLVAGFAGKSSSGMLAAIIGQALSLALGFWWTRDIWMTPGTMPDWRAWLRQVIPLTLGTGTIMVFMTADVVFVQSVFAGDTTSYYLAPQKVGFALVQFTVPVALVMYPKIVRSAATATKSDALKLTLIATGVFGVAAALATMVLPELPLRVLFMKSPEYWVTAPLVPWFVWCMVALTLANVLVGNLLAREQFAIVPWLVMLAAVYVATLLTLSSRLLEMDRDAAFRLIVQILMGFNLLMFFTALWFTSRGKSSVRQTGQVTRVA